MTAQGIPLSVLAQRLRERSLLEDVRGEAVVTGITDDSRSVQKGDLFCAWRGESVDAHEFVPQAERAGAAAALVEHAVESTLPQLIARDGRRAASVSAGVIFGEPQNRLRVIGITGTNGKTTSVWLLRHLLTPDHRAAAIGTLGVYLPHGRKVEGSERLTTPGPVELMRTLRLLVDLGADAVTMEVSSHALEQGRAYGIAFDVAVFTNLTRDHLDYHGTEDAYLAAKLKLAEQVRENGCAVINARVSEWNRVRDRVGRVLTFGVDVPADLQASHIIVTENGTRFVCTYEGDVVPVSFPLLGAYNVENALGALGASVALGMDLRAAAERLANVPQVPGRLERIASQPCTVLRDYAHTPDALERVLRVLRPLTRGRLIVVFGAGGDRDPGKRPLMGRIASENADVAIVTSDNPRTEDPEQIIAAIVAGMPRNGHVVIPDRRDAIRYALEHARRGDVVLLAGKGHETYQVVGTTKIPFDEKQVVSELLNGTGGRS